MLRIVVLTALCLSFIIGPRSVHAGYEWCSVDPTLTFTRDTIATGVLDVQVQVPLSALPLAEPAQLTVRIPSNVVGTEVLNTSVAPLFRLETTFAHVKTAVSTSPYEIELVLRVPSHKQTFPVRLVVTNPGTGDVTVLEGTSGKTLRQTHAIVD